MKLTGAVLFAAALAAAGAGHAAGLGLRAGTTGLGADLGFGLTDSVSLRLGYAGLAVSRDFDEDDVRYDAKIRLSNLSALVDWRFWRQMRLTAGLVRAKNTADLVGRPTADTFTINDVEYDADEIRRLRGEARVGRDATPYLGIGYGDISRPGFSLFMDLGIMFHGSPSVDLSVSCGATARCAELRRDVAREERDLRDEVAKFKYYPVFNLGLAFGW